MISVRSTMSDVTSQLTELERRKIPKATRQALNRLGVTVRKVHRDNLAEELQPRRKRDVSKGVDFTKARAGKPYIELVTNEDFLHLGQVKDTKIQSYRKGKRRVQRVRFRGRTVKGAFRPTNLKNSGGGAGRSIFRQAPGKYSTGSRRIRKLYAFSILQELEKKKLHKRVEKISAKRFRIEFGRALANQLRRP